MSRQTENKAKRRAAWKAAGVCYQCGRALWKDTALCIEHLERNRIYSRDRKRRLSAERLSANQPEDPT